MLANLRQVFPYVEQSAFPLEYANAMKLIQASGFGFIIKDPDTGREYSLYPESVSSEYGDETILCTDKYEYHLFFENDLLER